MDVQHFKQVLKMQEGISTTKCGSDVVYYHRNLEAASSKTILILIHGYPETSFMWRHVIPLLPADLPLFVPDIPGYGRSTPSTTVHDKRTIGNSILEALRHQIGHDREQNIVVSGHDRGARISHRLAVDASQKVANFNITGAILLDIVPTVVQFQSFADPSASVGTFHWPLLANAELATDMIEAYGGGKFCELLIRRWAGSDKIYLQSLESDDAMAIYGGYFSKRSVILATSEDYRAGAKEDIEQQNEDQAKKKRLACETLVVYSADYLGARYDVRAVWNNWVDNPENLEVESINGSGHFIAEETPESTAKFISKFMEGK